MTRRRSHGEGSIKRRGETTWRLRYRSDGQRFSTTFHGSLADARKELRRLLRSGDTGTHVDPTKITLGQWIEQWLAAGAPGRRKQPIGRLVGSVDEGLRLHRQGFDFIGYSGDVWILQDALAAALDALRKGGG